MLMRWTWTLLRLGTEWMHLPLTRFVVLSRGERRVESQMTSFVLLRTGGWKGSWSPGAHGSRVPSEPTASTARAVTGYDAIFLPIESTAQGWQALWLSPVLSG